MLTETERALKYRIEMLTKQEEQLTAYIELMQKQQQQQQLHQNVDSNSSSSLREVRTS